MCIYIYIYYWYTLLSDLAFPKPLPGTALDDWQALEL